MKQVSPMDKINVIGRRKAAVARLYMDKGEGNILINGRPYEEYFNQRHVRQQIMAPFQVVELDTKLYDIKVNVKGGGFKGQAEAVRLAIARALVQLNEEYRPALKAHKYLTRDSRVVERKKYGKPKARKSFQFSKR